MSKNILLALAASFMQMVLLAASQYFNILIEQFILWFVIYYGLVFQTKDYK